MAPRGKQDEPRLVVVCDSLGNLGGTERVLRAVLDRWPRTEVVAPLFGEGNVPPGLAARPPWPNPTRIVHRSPSRRPVLAPLYARRIARVPLDGASLVLSLSHAGWSLAAGVPPGVPHVTYCAGVPGALYDERDLYRGEHPPALRPLARAATPFLRAYNRHLLRRPDRVLTNSHWSAATLRHHTGVSAEVVYPPVRTGFFTPAPVERRHALVVSRLVTSKRVDIAVEAFRSLPGRLVVAGGGPLLDALRRAAPSNVAFTGWVGDEALRDLYRTASVLVCPSREEFGLVMAEALASGVPVIAPHDGGALELVRDGVTGLLLDQVDPPSIAAAISAVDRLPAAPDVCRASVARFAEERFVASLEHVFEHELAVRSLRPAPAARLLRAR